MSDPITKPDTIKTDPGVMTEVTAPFDSADTVRWWASAGLQLRPYGIGDKAALVAAVAPGTYTLLAWAALGGKPTEAVEFTVVVGDGAPPEPARQPWRLPKLPAFPTLPSLPSLGKLGDVLGPAMLALALLYGVTHFQGCSLPPIPWVNPTPSDPFLTTMQSAYGADGSATKDADRKALAEVYRRGGAETVKKHDIETAGALLVAMRTQANAAVSDRLAGVRQVIATELDKTLPRVPSATLDDATRAKIGEQFNRMAKLLEALK